MRIRCRNPQVSFQFCFPLLPILSSFHPTGLLVWVVLCLLDPSSRHPNQRLLFIFSSLSFHFHAHSQRHLDCEALLVPWDGNQSPGTAPRQALSPALRVLSWIWREGIHGTWRSYASFAVQHMVRNLPAMQKTQVWSLGRQDPLEKGMATHSKFLAWKIPQTEEPGRLQSMGLQWVRHD